MTEEEKTESELSNEFQRLGENLKNAITSAWGEGRQTLATEVEEGLNKVAQAIEGAAKEISDDPTVKRIREDAEEFAERVRSGEVQREVQADLRTALQKINQELENATAKWTRRAEESPPEEDEA